MAVARSKVRRLPAISPTGLAESSSLSLRTGYSPQVALHPSLRKRSYLFWIQGGNVTLAGTCTLQFKRLRRRTRTAVLSRLAQQKTSDEVHYANSKKIYSANRFGVVGTLDSDLHTEIAGGWLGRTADTWHSKNANGPDSVYVGSDSIPIALRGRRSEAMSLSEESDLLLNTTAAGGTAPGETADDLTIYVQRSLESSFASARRFAETSKLESSYAVAYPVSELARKLHLVSRLIKLGGGARIYYVTQPGYDTHSAQLFTHQQLLREFSQGLKAFLDDLHAAKLDQQVAVMALSEFGRRVQENGSAGTDHGVAGPMFLAGGDVRSGIVGAHPSLTDLDDGALKVSIDFRHIYSSVLRDWLDVSSEAIGIKSDDLKLFDV